ncbi:EthD family reductase [Aeromicrobium ginsengisoli]|uniref:EthD family reductase n=1 Tax=Aeromicrobium ginsengisoli TaxID=363867 RepID=A0A5M4F9H3_9ACTN|nr:EthD family reductase [Aeromicrobium ginsengisoli]KAA1394343.1 EthD family reductase [Aeromicrobium ginsengisoli]
MHRITVQYGVPADPEAFEQHYTEVHVPLASTLPGLRRFVRSHPRAMGGDAPYFVAELWFDDADALKTALKSPEMAKTAADAQTFDVASMTTFTGEVTETNL